MSILRPGSYRRQDNPLAPVEAIARETQVPVNVLLAFAERGGARSPEEIERLARGMASELAPQIRSGADVRELIRAAAGDEADAFLTRARQIGEHLYPAEMRAARQAQARPQEDEGGLRLGDYPRSFAGGVLEGVGSIIEGAGQLADAPLSLARDGTYAPGVLARAGRGAGDFLRDRANEMRAGMSPAARRMIEQSMPSGDITRPSTWETGEAPSITGYTLLAADVLGSFLPVVLAGLVGRGGSVAMAVGGAQSAGAGASEAREIVRQAYQTQGEDGRSLLEAESAYFREMLAQGMEPDEAFEATQDAASRLAALFTAPVGALGGAATAAVLRGTLPAGVGATGGRLRQALVRGTLSGAEEGFQEAWEGVAARYGVQVATGMQVNLTEDTFGDFILGALGGVPVGGVAGALQRRDEEPPPPPPPGAGTPPAAPPPLGLPSPTSGGTIFQGGPGQSTRPGGSRPVYVEIDGVATPGVIVGGSPNGVVVQDAAGNVTEVSRADINSGRVRITPREDEGEAPEAGGAGPAGPTGPTGSGGPGGAARPPADLSVDAPSGTPAVEMDVEEAQRRLETVESAARSRGWTRDLIEMRDNLRRIIGRNETQDRDAITEDARAEGEIVARRDGSPFASEAALKYQLGKLGFSAGGTHRIEARDGGFVAVPITQEGEGDAAAADGLLDGVGAVLDGAAPTPGNQPQAGAEGAPGAGERDPAGRGPGIDQPDRDGVADAATPGQPPGALTAIPPALTAPPAQETTNEQQIEQPPQGQGLQGRQEGREEVSPAAGVAEPAPAQPRAPSGADPEMRQRTPLMNRIIALGGIARARRNAATGDFEPTKAAAELESRGITPRTHPRLFSNTGMTDLDNIDPDSLSPDARTLLGMADDGRYVSQDALYDALASETGPGGKPFDLTYATQQAREAAKEAADRKARGLNSTVMDEDGGDYLIASPAADDATERARRGRIEKLVREAADRYDYSEAEIENVIARLMGRGGWVKDAFHDEAIRSVETGEWRPRQTRPDPMEGVPWDDGDRVAEAGADPGAPQPVGETRGEPAKDDRGRTPADQGVTYEPGAEGLPQAVVPGAEGSQDQAERMRLEQAKREAEARQQQSKIRKGNQKRVEDDEGGLFGEPKRDLFDAPPAKAEQAAADPALEAWGKAASKIITANDRDGEYGFSADSGFASVDGGEPNGGGRITVTTFRGVRYRGQRATEEKTRTLKYPEARSVLSAEAVAEVERAIAAYNAEFGFEQPAPNAPASNADQKAQAAETAAEPATQEGGDRAGDQETDRFPTTLEAITEGVRRQRANEGRLNHIYAEYRGARYYLASVAGNPDGPAAEWRKTYPAASIFTTDRADGTSINGMIGELDAAIEAQGVSEWWTRASRENEGQEARDVLERAGIGFDRIGRPWRDIREADQAKILAAREPAPEVQAPPPKAGEARTATFRGVEATAEQLESFVSGRRQMIRDWKKAQRQSSAQGKAVLQTKIDSAEAGIAEAEALIVDLRGKAPPSTADTPKAKIEDFGEKIGGARKDTASRGWSRPEKGKEDTRPGWQKRYEVQQIAASMKAEEKGKWTVYDTKASRHVRDGYRTVMFDTEQEARDAIPLYEVSRTHRVQEVKPGEFGIYRRISDRKRFLMQGGFPTREAAMTHMAENAIDLIERNVRIDEGTIHPAIENAIRKGAERRKDDRPVTEKDFAEVFGFRGVQFGEWNNIPERQHILNQAYDAFLDLASITGLPPKALSLNGDLALAFGARGHGLVGAKAHYERDHGIINLTKIQGAGSLAHEWMHAVDHYFGRQDGKASSEKVPYTWTDRDGVEHTSWKWKARDQSDDYASHGFQRTRSGVRPEVREAWGRVVEAMLYRKVAFTEDKSTREKIAERSKGDLERRLKDFRAHLAATLTYGSRKAPASEAQLQRADGAIKRILEGDLGEKQLAPSKSQYASFTFHQPVMVLSDILKQVRNTQGFGMSQNRKVGQIVDVQNAIDTWVQAQSFLQDANASREKHKKVKTEFFSEAWRLDQTRAGDYWLTNHEMMARAFESFVYDRLKDIEAQNDFLSYEKHNNLPIYRMFNVKPYPEGQERADINAAFDALFDAIQTRETDQGVEMYSRRTPLHSATLRAVEALPMARGDGSQFLSMLMKQPGVKREELDWLGLPDFLRGREKVTRDEVAAFVRQNQVQVIEHRKGGVTRRDDVAPSDSVVAKHKDKWDELNEKIAEAFEAMEAARRDTTEGAPFRYSDLQRRWSSLNDEQEALHDLMVNQTIQEMGGLEGETKFDDWRTKGGRGYRELLLAMPDPVLALAQERASLQGAKTAFRERMFAKYGNGFVPKLSPEESAEYTALIERVEAAHSAYSAAQASRPDSFRSSHWSEPNVLAHIRFDERDVSVPLTEAQRGQNERRSQLQAEFDRLTKELGDAIRQTTAERKPIEDKIKAEVKADILAGKVRPGDYMQEVINRTQDLPPTPGMIRQREIAERRRALNMPDEAKPTAERTLFIQEIQSDWHQAGRKKGYRGAIDTTGWTAKKGEGGWVVRDAEGREVPYAGRHLFEEDAIEAAARSRQERAVPDAPLKKTWHETAFRRAVAWAVEHGYDSVTWATGDMNAELFDLSQRIDSLEWTWHPATKEIEVQAQTPGGDPLSMWRDRETLDDAVGKDMASRINAAIDAGKTTDTYRGLDLKVGGEGMRGFYDRIIPAYAAKWGKRFGATVGKVKVATDRSDGYGWRIIPPHQSTSGRWVVGQAPNGPNQYFDTEAEARAAFEAGQRTVDVWHMPITDSMRETVQLEGVALFDRQSAQGNALTAKRESIKRDLAEAWGRLKLPQDARLRVVDRLFGMDPDGNTVPVNGSYVRGLVQVALDSTEGVLNTLHHEAIHMLRDPALWGRPYGLFSKAEWDALEAVAKRAWMAKHDIAARYPDLTAEQQIEEAIAAEFAEVSGSRKPVPTSLVGRALAKIRGFIEALGAALRGAGFNENAGAIFEAILSGEVGSRGRARGEGRAAPQFSRAPAVDSPAFKRWFGNSKVVDAEGKPLVVYHGTDAARQARTIGRSAASGLYQIDPTRGDAIWFGSSGRASGYASEVSGETALGGQVYPVYLSIQNPLEIDAEGRSWTEADGNRSTDEITKRAKRDGYDGVIFRNVLDNAVMGSGDTSTTYAVFSPEQVKSTFNRGTFDPADPRIAYSRGETIPANDLRGVAEAVSAEVRRSIPGLKVSVRLVRGLMDAAGVPIQGRQRGAQIEVNPASGDGVLGTLRHEIVHLLRDAALWGEPYGLFTRPEWQGLVRSARADRALAAKVAQAYPDLGARDQIEEVIAEQYRRWARNMDQRSGVDRAFQKVKAFLQAVANALRGRGFQSAALTFERIASGGIGGRGPGGPGGEAGPAREQRAFHGTPHDFDRFSTAFMGTGEGAQAFGWGLYFAGRKGVAEHYKKSVSRNEGQLVAVAEKKGLTGDAAAMLGHQFAMGFHGKNFDAWLDSIKGAMDDPLLSKRSRAAIQQIVDKSSAASDAVREMKAPGHLFEVEIPDDKDLLDWDRKLSEQPPKVKAALKKLGYEPDRNAAIKDFAKRHGLTEAEAKDFAAKSMTLDADKMGHAIYQEMSRKFRDAAYADGAALTARMTRGGQGWTKDNLDRHAQIEDRYNNPDRAASLALRDAGIPGHRFLDGRSRSPGEGTHNYVIYDEAAVEVMGKESRGLDQPRSPDGRFASHAAKYSRAMLADGGPVTAKKERGIVGQILTDAMGGISSRYNLLALVPSEPLFQELAKNLPSAQTYLKLKHAMSAMRNERQANAAGLIDKWRSAMFRNSKANAAMMDLMHEATIAGLDPAKPFVAPERKTNELPEDHAARVEERREKHEALKARWDKLPKALQDIYTSVRDAYGEIAATERAIITDNVKTAMELTMKRARLRFEDTMKQIAEEGLTGPEREAQEAKAAAALEAVESAYGRGAASRLRSLRLMFEQGRVDPPYFPLMRYGNYYATVKDKAGKLVSFSKFETEREMMRAAAALKADNPGMTVKTGLMLDKDGRPTEVDPNFVADVQEILGDAVADAGLMDAIWQRYLETLPDFSIRKSRLHRKGTPGYAADAFRNYARQSFHSAHQLARLKYGMQMQMALDDAAREADAAPDPTRATTVVNEMGLRHKWVMNPQTSAWSTWATGAAFVYYLGATPAAALVNISQSVVVGIPVLSAAFEKGTIGGASRHLMRGLRDFGLGRGEVEKSKRLTDDERAAIRELARRGVIDKTQSHDLAGYAESGVDYNDIRQRIMKPIAFLFHQAERLNREITGIAAYRMARENGFSHEDAIDKAANLTWKSHFNYESDSRPRLQHNDFVRVATVFKNYQLNMLYRLFRDTHQAFEGASEADRKEARAQLVGITGMMMLMAGVSGTWGYALITTLLGLFMPGGADDIEQEIKEALVNTLGTDMAGMVLQGVPGHLTGINLSQRMGMPELWFRRPDRQQEGDELYQYWAEQVLGAVPGMVQNAFRGFSMAMEGEVWRGIETASPKAVRDWMRGYRYASDGVTTYRGNPILEDVSPMEALTQAIGFSPARVSERYQTNRWMRNTEQRIVQQRRDILRQIGEDVRSSSGISQASRDAMRAFNAEYPEYPITGDTIRQHLRSRARGERETIDGLRLNPRLDQRIRAEIAPTIHQR